MRAQVVLVKGDRILLARHQKQDGSYWVLPGGAIEEGEAPEDAAVREIREETGLEIGIQRLLFIEEPCRRGGVPVTSSRYTFLGSIVGGELRDVQDSAGGHAEKGFLAGCEWSTFISPNFDEATRATLELVMDALSRSSSSTG